MNFADSIIRQCEHFLNEAREDFRAEMQKAIDKYENEKWITSVIVDEELENNSFQPKHKRFKLKCNTLDLIEMDRAQIKATEFLDARKIVIVASRDTALKGQELMTSAWFTGEPLNRTFY
ncbi:Hypothetical protein KNT65_gp094 [Escherichia phage EcS1]|uniref:Uncharacterized protein n=1 Tax=Escherichia phage EcS1 TaxID=2083276 RepID=A0A2Z5ZCL7_9CAUD|nr:Hypothetical protein KNT65_gp094 [Escherichia phage EcS1]BBC78142.1 Hypothetical protein [Escherichia phage EcS1]